MRLDPCGLGAVTKLTVAGIGDKYSMPRAQTYLSGSYSARAGTLHPEIRSHISLF